MEGLFADVRLANRPLPNASRLVTTSSTNGSTSSSDGQDPLHAAESSPSPRTGVRHKTPRSSNSKPNHSPSSATSTTDRSAWRQAEALSQLAKSLVDQTQKEQAEALEIQRSLSNLQSTVKSSKIQMDRLKAKVRSLEDERVTLVRQRDEADARAAQLDQSVKELAPTKKSLGKWRSRARDLISQGQGEVDEGLGRDNRDMDDFELWEAVLDHFTALASRQIQSSSSALVMENGSASENEE